MTNEELDFLKDHYDKEKLTDISSLKLYSELLSESMFNEYIKKVKNPYHFKSGTVDIDILYSDSTDKTVSELLRDYFLRQK